MTAADVGHSRAICGCARRRRGTRPVRRGESASREEAFGVDRREVDVAHSGPRG